RVQIANLQMRGHPWRIVREVILGDRAIGKLQSPNPTVTGNGRKVLASGVCQGKSAAQPPSWLILARIRSPPPLCVFPVEFYRPARHKAKGAGFRPEHPPDAPGSSMIGRPPAAKLRLRAGLNCLPVAGRSRQIAMCSIRITGRVLSSPVCRARLLLPRGGLRANPFAPPSGPVLEACPS